jgi:inorganic triphosphatase YgiF
MSQFGASAKRANQPALPVETELKLSLPAAQANQLWKVPPLATLLVNRPTRQRLFSAYYDTPHLDLRKRGVALRLRRDGRRWVQTVKKESKPSGGLQQRIELEVVVPRGALDQEWLKHTGIAEFTDEGFATNALGIVFTTEFDRSLAIIEPEKGTRVEVAIDQGAIVAGTRREPLCEVELELKQGDLAPLFDLAEQLVALPDIRIESVSKAQRGYRMAARERPEPAKAISTKLSGSDDVDTVFQALAFGCIAQMQANEYGVLHTHDIEYVHQARVALRRLRSVFGLFSGAIPKSHFRDQLAWLSETSHMLGEARDWDVFVTEFLRDASESMTDYPALPDLKKTSASLRGEARRRVRTELVSADYEVHMLRLTQTLHAQDWGRDRSMKEQEIAALAPKAFAASIVGRAHRKVVRQGRRLERSNLNRSNYTGFHELRINIKKLRYASELLAPLFGNKSTRKYLAHLADLQKILGQLNDAATAVSLVDRLAPGKDDPAYLQAIGHLKGYAAAKSRFSLSDFNSVWKKFEATTTFW